MEYRDNPTEKPNRSQSRHRCRGAHLPLPRRQPRHRQLLCRSTGLRNRDATGKPPRRAQCQPRTRLHLHQWASGPTRQYPKTTRKEKSHRMYHQRQPRLSTRRLPLFGNSTIGRRYNVVQDKSTRKTRIHPTRSHGMGCHQPLLNTVSHQDKEKTEPIS